MYEDSSLRNKPVKAISSALPLLRSRTVLLITLDCIFLTSRFELIDAVRSVSIQPGWITLHRVPQSAYTYAADRDSPSSAHLEEE